LKNHNFSFLRESPSSPNCRQQRAFLSLYPSPDSTLRGIVGNSFSSNFALESSAENSLGSCLRSFAFSLLIIPLTSLQISLDLRFSRCLYTRRSVGKGRSALPPPFLICAFSRWTRPSAMSLQPLFPFPFILFAPKPPTPPPPPPQPTHPPPPPPPPPPTHPP